MTFVGLPGTGKYMLADKFAIALIEKPIPKWAYYTSSSFEPGMSPQEQLFHPSSELVRHLKANKGKTVIFIDEIDKFDSNSLLESFMDAVDRGNYFYYFSTRSQNVWSKIKYYKKRDYRSTWFDRYSQ